MKKLFTLLAALALLGNVANAQIGTVLAEQKISDTQGNFNGVLSNNDRFGSSADGIGDINGDGTEDIAIGAIRDDDGGTDRGAVYILFMNTNGTIQSETKISDTQGNFSGVLDDGDIFGTSVTKLGDLNGDSIPDIAVGAYTDDDGGFDRGAVWVLFLNANGTVQSHQKISDTQGNFNGILSNQDYFGHAVGTVGDLDNDGVSDMIVGAPYSDDGGGDRGAAWILFLNSNGTVKSEQKISDTQGGFTGVLDDVDVFGRGVEGIGDLDGDGIEDAVVGARFDDDGGTDRGAVWVLFLETNGTVKDHQKISDTQGGFTGVLDDNDLFSTGLGLVGDINCDGLPDIVVGAERDDDGGTDRGGVWVLMLDVDGTVKAHQKISDTQGNFNGSLDNDDFFSFDLGDIGDLNNDGYPDIVCTAFGDDDGGTDKGAVYVLFLEAAVGVSASYTSNMYFGNCTGNILITPIGGTAPFTYLWDDPNTQTTQTATGLCAGTYCVTVTDDNGCSWDTCGIEVLVGIDELYSTQEITIYPNPTEGKFEVRSLELGVEKIEVYDLFGRLVLSSTSPQIDMRGYAKGMYFVQLGDAVRKLILH